jgi:hypothetical protein
MSTSIDLEMQDHRVREFFESLPVTADGTAIRINGRRSFLVVDEPILDASEPSEWTPEKDDRRVYLIDRKIAGTIDDRESIELARLQREMGRWLDHVAPLPLEDARKLHRELLAIAREAESNRKK